MSKQNGPLGIFAHIGLRIVPPVALMFISVWYGGSEIARRTMESELHDRLDEAAAISTAGTSHQFDTVVEGVRTIAANDLVINGLIDIEARENYLPTYFLSLRIPRVPGARIFLLDYRGRPIIWNTARESFEDAPWIKDVIGGSTLQTLSISGLQIAIPVLYSGLPEGILVVQIGLDEFPGLLEPVLGRGAHALIDETGLILYSTDPEFATAGTMNHERGQEEWFTVRTLIDAFPQIAVLSGQSVERALAPLRRLQKIMLAALAAGLLAIVAVIGVTAYRIAIPLRVFGRRIVEISNSEDLARRIEPAGPREIFDLGEAFNGMAERLQKTIASHDYIDNVIASMNDGMLVTAADGSINTANPAACRLLGYDLQEIIGLSIDRFFPPNECHPATPLLPQARRNVESELRHKDGRLIPIVYSTGSLTNRDGEFQGTVYLTQDITFRKRAEEEERQAKKAAEEANEAKSRFVASVSHELRTPLNAIIGYSELLFEDAEGRGDSELSQDLERINTAGHHLLSLINNVLDLAKIEAGKIELDMQVFDVAELVHEVAQGTEGLMAQNANRLDIRCAPNLAAIEGDETKIRQILYNLLSNAAKFTENGVVGLEADRVVKDGGEYIRFRVTDTGVGIDPDKIDESFEEFTQLGGKTTHRSGGTGLGLALTRGFCEAMGGMISAKSNPGKGSTFTVHIPAIAVADLYEGAAGRRRPA